MSSYGDDFGGRSNTRIAESLLSLNEKYNLDFKRSGKKIFVKGGKNYISSMGCFFLIYAILSFIVFLIFLPSNILIFQNYSFVQIVSLVSTLFGIMLFFMIFFVRSYMVFDFNSGTFYIIEKLFGINIGGRKSEIIFTNIKAVGVTAILEMILSDLNGIQLPKEKAFQKIQLFYPKEITEEDIDNGFNKLPDEICAGISVSWSMVFQNTSGEVFEISQPAFYKEAYEELVDIATVFSCVLEIPFLCCERNEKLIFDPESEEKELKKVALFDEEDGVCI